MQKPKVFIGCSQEGLRVAGAIKKHLSSFCTPVLWNSGVFKISRYTLESLERMTNECEYAVFVFTPDDKVRSRGQNTKAPRDNVILETGLFLGKRGRERTFIVADEHVKIPTDMHGLVLAKFKWKKQKTQKTIKTEMKPVSERIFESMQIAPRLSCNTFRNKPGEPGRIGGEDELFSTIVGKTSKRNGVLVSHTNTTWVWKLFPLLLEWRRRKIPVLVALSPISGDAKAQRQEKYRRNLMRNLGASLVETKKIAYKAFCLDYLSVADTEVLVINDDTSGCHPFATRYKGEEHSPARTEIVRQIQSLFRGRRHPLYTPRTIKFDWDSVGDILKSSVSQYSPTSVRIEKACVQTSKLFVISRFTREYKYRQISYWNELYKEKSLQAFGPFSVGLKDRSVTVATPPVVEVHDGKYVVIEGNTRATYFSKNKIGRFPCLLVTGVSESLPAAPFPISKVLVSERTLAPDERMPGFDYAKFRHIERAMHPY